ncbi:DUF3572 domain-containing protein [Ancylobacter sp. 6x-1]|uniref:DUF3572 domain-containing protein n=1 Tax=Ancylobacter crimeensis TaxID=2579147 RepID=A0ABT0DCA6_9HYPH|nr:DUF3572 domain-containing protein [Ancylobacter crimeensis]MCK0197591.1 DUF3572 domain-containing protein [Ancylobacter crimeensis]
MALGRPTGRKPISTALAAREVAIGAITFLISDPERIGPMLAESGLSPGDLRGAVSSPAFQVGVLDYLITRQDLLIEYAGHAGIDPGHVVAAREILANQSAGRRES